MNKVEGKIKKCMNEKCFQAYMHTGAWNSAAAFAVEYFNGEFPELEKLIRAIGGLVIEDE